MKMAPPHLELQVQAQPMLLPDVQKLTAGSTGHPRSNHQPARQWMMSAVANASFTRA